MITLLEIISAFDFLLLKLVSITVEISAPGKLDSANANFLINFENSSSITSTFASTIKIPSLSYIFKISKYSEELLTSLENMPKWPEKVRTMQKNWIGKSTGLEINFALKIMLFIEDHDLLITWSFPQENQNVHAH